MSPKFSNNSGQTASNTVTSSIVGVLAGPSYAML